MLNAGWDDDLRAFAKSWASQRVWLQSSESVHPKRWQKSNLGTLQAYFGSRLANLPSQLSRADLFAAASGINANLDEVFLLTMMWCEDRVKTAKEPLMHETRCVDGRFNGPSRRCERESSEAIQLHLVATEEKLDSGGVRARCAFCESLQSSHEARGLPEVALNER